MFSAVDHTNSPVVLFCSRCNTFFRPQFEDSICECRKYSHIADDGNHDDADSQPNLTEMDSEIKQIERDIEILQNRRALACRERNSHIPIARLPVEIMSEIFMWGFVDSYVEDRDVEPTTFPLMLGRICHDWRRIAWRVSVLWSFLRLRISRRKCSIQASLLNEWLNRSRPRLVSISLTMEDEDAWTNSPDIPMEIIDNLVSHSDRWRRLSLILPVNWHERLFRARGKTPNLISLSMRPPKYAFTNKVLDAFLEAPDLQTLHVSHFYLQDLHFPWTQLTAVYLGTASTDEALELVRRCENLTTCQFEDLSEAEESFPLDVVINPHLRSLEVSLNSAATVDNLLTYLVLSNLGSLSLTLPEGHMSPIPVIEAFAERSACPLKALQITGPSINDEDIIIFLTYNSSVTDLRVKPSVINHVEGQN